MRVVHKRSLNDIGMADTNISENALKVSSELVPVCSLGVPGHQCPLSARAETIQRLLHFSIGFWDLGQVCVQPLAEMGGGG